MRVVPNAVCRGVWRGEASSLTQLAPLQGDQTLIVPIAEVASLGPG